MFAAATHRRTSRQLPGGAQCVRHVVAGLVTAMLAVAPHVAAVSAQEPDRQLPQPVARAKRSESATLERGSKALAVAKLRQQTAPSLDSERALAQTYLSAGVLDAAFDHFTAALVFDPHDVPSLDGLARIWREWGYLDNALPLAYQAVYWAPGSAAAHNTLGSVLLKLGATDAARARFTTAHQLAPSAAYPLNNLCYLELQQGHVEAAVPLCSEASALDLDDLPEVRNNLALSLAFSGDLAGSLAAFESGASPAVAAYNHGIVLLAARQLDRARDAFARARTADPAFAPALSRLRQLARRAGQ